MYDIIVIGAGPAGLTSAIYAARAAKKVLVLEALNYGGQIINSMNIENYPAEIHVNGVDFATKIYKQAKELGAEVKFEKVIEVNDLIEQKEVITNENSYKARSVIIATGLKNRELGLANEKELTGKGISYCATCDGHFYKGRNVAVVGGGNTALEDALYLSDIVENVYVIHRRDQFRGDEKTVEYLKNKNNVKFFYNSNITKLNGDEKLESVEITDNQDGRMFNISVSGLFIAIGKIPENGIFNDLINLDDNGYIIAGEDCHTNIDGIFVAGDNRTKTVRQLVTATGDGAVAATEAIKYINNKNAK